MCNCIQVKQDMNHYDIDTQVMIVIAYTMRHNLLQEYQGSRENSRNMTHDNTIANDIDQQTSQSNNVGSSFQSFDLEICA